MNDLHIPHRAICTRCGSRMRVTCDSTFGDWFREFWRECWADPMKTVPLAVLAVFIPVILLILGV